MLKYIYLLISLISCVNSDLPHNPPPARPVFPGWDNFYCYLKDKESLKKYWMPLKSSNSEEFCKQEEIRYFLHLSVPNTEDASCVSLAEEALKKRDFLKEFADESEPLTAKEKHLERMSSGKEDYYRRKYCALQKLEKMGEFDIENSGVIGCCPFDFDSYSCGEGWFRRRKICACALHIKTKSNLKEFYEKLEKYECEPKE